MKNYTIHAPVFTEHEAWQATSPMAIELAALRRENFLSKRSPLRRPHSEKISRKVGLVVDIKQFSNTL